MVRPCSGSDPLIPHSHSARILPGKNEWARKLVPREDLKKINQSSRQVANASPLLYHPRAAFPRCWQDESTKGSQAGWKLIRQGDYSERLSQMGNGPRVLHFGAPLCGCCHDVRSTATQSCHVDSPARGGPYHCVSGPQWELGVCVAEKENFKPQMAETRIVMAHSPNQGLRLGFNPISGKFRAWDA